jgi:RNA polymerase sigma-70 factor (ECF subfamily)
VNQEPDRQLIERIAAKDQSAVTELFERYQVRVFRFIQRLVRNEAVSEELANEVFLEIWRSAGRFSGKSQVATWMLAIARNKAISHLRRRREESIEDYEHAARKMEDSQDRPDVAAIKGDKATILRQCINRLSAEHREVLDLVYYHEHTTGEVAEIIGIPVSTVKTRMFHARKILSESLRKAGIDRGWP